MSLKMKIKCEKNIKIIKDKVLKIINKNSKNETTVGELFNSSVLDSIQVIDHPKFGKT